MKIQMLAIPFVALVAWASPGSFGLGSGAPSWSGAQDEVPDEEQVELAEQAALEVGRAYLAGISGGDLDDLDELFVAEERSSVFENGSDEGSWSHYKEHHLAPEQAAVENFRFTAKEEFSEKCGDGFLVRSLGGFSLDVQGETRSFRAAVTFVIVSGEDGPRILHLHWSSRELR